MRVESEKENGGIAAESQKIKEIKAEKKRRISIFPPVGTRLFSSGSTQILAEFPILPFLTKSSKKRFVPSLPAFGFGLLWGDE